MIAMAHYSDFGCVRFHNDLTSEKVLIRMKKIANNRIRQFILHFMLYNIVVSVFCNRVLCKCKGKGGITMVKSNHFRLAFVFVVIAAVLLTCVTHFNVSAAGRFSDVSDTSWYADAVNWAVDNSITSGTSSTTFSPDQPCTRAQIITFLYRYKDSPEVSGTMQFTDVTAPWMQNPVLWASQNNITSGTGTATFSPNIICTRAQVVTFLYRMLDSDEKASGQLFSDVTKSNYAYDAVSWAKNHNITAGTGDGKFNPNAPCTRSQAITFLYRAYQDAQTNNVDSSATVSQKQALTAAKQYLDMMGFSYQGLIDQLSSPYGSGFSVEDATWAVNNCGADWNQEALQAAKSYLDMKGFSYQGLIDQLSSDYGDKFTVDQATYAADNCGADWYEEAVRAGQSYLNLGGFSRNRLIEQLSSEYGENFTLDQATYAADQLGL